jgi:2-polyprenyl-3-methyl-5-hydroxy-6-metoxy-1,4-benzoquinol methylase
MTCVEFCFLMHLTTEAVRVGPYQRKYQRFYCNMSKTPIPNAPILRKFLLTGRNIVITGGCRGLGLLFAQTLASVGANIAVIDLNEQPSEAFTALSSFGGKYKYYKANVVDYGGLKKTFDQIYADFESIDGWYLSTLQLNPTY